MAARFAPVKSELTFSLPPPRGEARVRVGDQSPRLKPGAVPGDDGLPVTAQRKGQKRLTEEDRHHKSSLDDAVERAQGRAKGGAQGFGGRSEPRMIEGIPSRRVPGPHRPARTRGTRLLPCNTTLAYGESNSSPATTTSPRRLRRGSRLRPTQRWPPSSLACHWLVVGGIGVVAAARTRSPSTTAAGTGNGCGRTSLRSHGTANET